MDTEVVVLAAGEGTRMKSGRPKVLQTLAGRTLLDHVLASASALAPKRIHVVIGHGADQVRSAFTGRSLNWVEQRERLGTGHAVLQALPQIDPGARMLVLYGDVPLVEPATLARALASADDALVLLTMEPNNPHGFGRILRDQQGVVTGIVEERDATPEQRTITEVNSGIMAMPVAQVAPLLERLSADNDQGEYLLTDLVALACDAGLPIKTAGVDPLEVAGINDRVQLAEVERALQRRQATALMRAGLSLADPARFDLRGELQHGRDCFIDVNVLMEGRVALGERVRVGTGAVLRDVTIADDVVIEPYSVIDGARIGAGANIGPFARLRPGTDLGPAVRIGNFVETKQAVLGAGSKANHLAYLGDTRLGADCNVGAGAITCNYDGVNKHRTEIGDRVFVGSNSTLVAPLTIADDAFVAAGSTVTTAVDTKSLAIGRARQRNIKGWQPPAARSPRG